jgi:thymidylate synthase (FAD)
MIQNEAPAGSLIPVLDHGFVRLVDHMGNDLSIVRAARVSYDADWRTGEDDGKDSKLINYLLTNRHTSPFEAVTFTFEVKAPLFVFRQWHRHRTWSFNEVSARYSELPEEFYLPEADQLNPQHASNKQMRIEGVSVEDVDVVLAFMRKANMDAFALYRALLGQGVARELARTVLPLASYSRMFATVDLHNLLHFLKLRRHAHAQYEIRVYADAMLELIKPVVPFTLNAFEALQ